MTLVPMVVTRESGGERSYDLFSRMLRDRIVFITGPIETNMAQLVSAQLLFLESDNSEEPINIYINSPGGEITAGYSIFDTMQFIKSPCYTTVMGMAASMGSFLAMAGEPGHRYALPNSEIMIHQPLSGVRQSQCTDIQIHAALIQNMKEKLTAEYAARCCGKKTLEEFFAVMERDRYMNPVEALEWGLIDRVITSRSELA